MIDKDYLKIMFSPPMPIPVYSMQIIREGVTNPGTLAAIANYDAIKKAQVEQYNKDKKIYDDYWSK